MFFKLLLAFSPWLAFLLIASDGLFRLKLGLTVGLILSIIMGLTRLHRGIILWVGLIFFSCATVAMLGFNSMWTAKHMGIMANGAMATASWLSIVVKKPFTMDYAREHTAKELWSSPLFIRTNIIITAVWGLAFTLNTFLAWGKMERFIVTGLVYEFITYTVLIGTVCFTCWYQKHINRLAARHVEPDL